MTPAEIWQAGHLVTRIEDKKYHKGNLDEKKVVIKGDEIGFWIDDDFCLAGNSITLDGEIIVKSVKD